MSFFTTLVAGYKKPLFKVFAHKDFLCKTGFEQMIDRRYGICFIRQQSFKHFGAGTIYQPVGTQKSLYTLN